MPDLTDLIDQIDDADLLADQPNEAFEALLEQARLLPGVIEAGLRLKQSNTPIEIMTDSELLAVIAVEGYAESGAD